MLQTIEDGIIFQFWDLKTLVYDAVRDLPIHRVRNTMQTALLFEVKTA